jgi:hypothetical protein
MVGATPKWLNMILACGVGDVSSHGPDSRVDLERNYSHVQRQRKANYIWGKVSEAVTRGKVS